MNLLYLLHYAKTKMVLKKTCIQRVGVIEGKITDTVFYAACGSEVAMHALFSYRHHSTRLIVVDFFVDFFVLNVGPL